MTTVSYKHKMNIRDQSHNSILVSLIYESIFEIRKRAQIEI